MQQLLTNNSPLDYMNFYGIDKIDKLSNNKAAVTHSIPLTVIKL